jgi:PAS domain-containing protein
MAESLTRSQIGFFHFLEADQQTLSLQMWSKNTLNNMCSADAKGQHYSIAQAGVWVDCIRRREPVIHNDYESLPHRKGMPPGHARVIRELVVPVFQGESLKAILGVGNKPSDYDESDVETVLELLDLAKEIVMRKRAEEALQKRNEFLTSVLESMAHPFYVIDADNYNIELANAAALSVGLSKGAACYAATHGRDLPCNDLGQPCPLPEVKRTGRPVEVQHVHYDRKGRARHMAVHAYPILDDQGKVVRIIEYCLDVTESVLAQQALRENEKTLSTILSMSPWGDRLFSGKNAHVGKPGHDESVRVRGERKGRIVGQACSRFL